MNGPPHRFALRRLPVARDGLPSGLLDTVVGWGLYVDGVRASEVRFEEACATARSGAGFVWLGVHAPNLRQLTQLGEIFGLHPLGLEDAANPRQRPKLDRFDDVLLLSMRTLGYVEADSRTEGGGVVETGSITVFVGSYFVVTVRHGRHASMTGLRHRLEADPRHLSLGPSAVMHAVTDTVVDEYLAVVDAVSCDIEEIEAEVFASRALTDIERMYQLKRDIVEMKRTVDALAGPLERLSARPPRILHEDIREYFCDVSDHAARVREQVHSFDELLSSILQAGLARLSVSENEDLRKISAWVAIAAVPTMIAAIYGMNFADLPGLSTGWAYPVVLGGTAVICGALHRGFRRNGWL